jgi:hypothetical protein
MKLQVISKLVLILGMMLSSSAFGLADAHFDFRNIDGETPMTTHDVVYLERVAQLVGGTVGASLRLESNANPAVALDELKRIHEGTLPPNAGSAVRCGIPCTGEKGREE